MQRKKEVHWRKHQNEKSSLVLFYYHIHIFQRSLDTQILRAKMRSVCFILCHALLFTHHHRHTSHHEMHRCKYFVSSSCCQSKGCLLQHAWQLPWVPTKMSPTERSLHWLVCGCSLTASWNPFMQQNPKLPKFQILPFPWPWGTWMCDRYQLGHHPVQVWFFIVSWYSFPGM